MSFKILFVIQTNKTQKIKELSHQRKLLLPHECKQERGSITNGEIVQLKL